VACPLNGKSVNGGLWFSSKSGTAGEALFLFPLGGDHGVCSEVHQHRIYRRPVSEERWTLLSSEFTGEKTRRKNVVVGRKRGAGLIS